MCRYVIQHMFFGDFSPKLLDFRRPRFVHRTFVYRVCCFPLGDALSMKCFFRPAYSRG